MLFDSHSHLDDQSFNEDREKVIERALLNDVSYIVNPAVDLESSYRILDLAQRYSIIYGAMGIHPHEVGKHELSAIETLKDLAQKPKIVAIGEIGLDYHYEFSDRETQKNWFRHQLAVAKQLKLPVIIHDREANDDVLRILKEENAFETGVLMHCYSGSKELARQYIELGAYISLAGPVTFKNARVPVEVASYVPLERLLIETDAPYLTPVPFRGKRNEPMYVRHTCEKISQIKEITFKSLAEATLQNAKTFFKID